jgi:drug/metabolite transporter, DME family
VPPSPPRPPAFATHFPLVVFAAALWGTDALFRQGLALELPASTVVFMEHLLLVAMTAPFLVRGLRAAWGRFNRADWVYMLLIGGGASATATVAFTAAFAYGDPNTPLLLQKLQPLFAVIAAHLILGERLLPSYGAYFVGGLAGAWLIAFPQPGNVSITAAAPALLAVSAALLWGLGTVFGRRLTQKISHSDLTALRFGFGLLAAAALLPVGGGGGALSGIGGNEVLALLLLALIPGLLGIFVYYRGLSGTPATAATLGELAFPLTAVLVNYLAFGATLVVTQWVGLVLLAVTMGAMSIAGRRGAKAVGVRVPSPA